MSIYRTARRSPPGKPARTPPEDVLLYVIGVVVALLPFVWLFATGAAAPLDLGLATIMLIACCSPAVLRWSRHRPESPREEKP